MISRFRLPGAVSRKLHPVGMGAFDRDTAVFLNKAANLKLVYEEKTGGIDMCEALERRYQEKEVTGAIKMLRSDGTSDEDIISKVIKLFGVTREYVLALLQAQVA